MSISARFRTHGAPKASKNTHKRVVSHTPVVNTGLQVYSSIPPLSCPPLSAQVVFIPHDAKGDEKKSSKFDFSKLTSWSHVRQCVCMLYACVCRHCMQCMHAYIAHGDTNVKWSSIIQGSHQVMKILFKGFQGPQTPFFQGHSRTLVGGLTVGWLLSCQYCRSRSSTT